MDIKKMEYFTKAIVLKREPKNDFDETVCLYTKDFGKISVFARGIRKITSKLSGHLQVGGMSHVRLLRNANTQIIDAVSHRSGLSSALHSFLQFIEKMTPYEFADIHLWYGVEHVIENSLFVSGPETVQNKVYRRFLDILGFGPKFAKCDNCGVNKIAYFHPSDIMFLCESSMKKLSINFNEVVRVSS